MHRQAQIFYGLQLAERFADAVNLQGLHVPPHLL
jgi:hypothetical protein